MNVFSNITLHLLPILPKRNAFYASFILEKDVDTFIQSARVAKKCFPDMVILNKAYIHKDILIDIDRTRDYWFLQMIHGIDDPELQLFMLQHNLFHHFDFNTLNLPKEVIEELSSSPKRKKKNKCMIQ